MSRITNIAIGIVFIYSLTIICLVRYFPKKYPINDWVGRRHLVINSAVGAVGFFLIVMAVPSPSNPALFTPQSTLAFILGVMFLWLISYGPQEIHDNPRLRNLDFSGKSARKKNLQIIEAVTLAHFASARELFVEYGDSLGFSLCFQSFDKELAELPGEYAPPSGRLQLAYWDGELAGCVALHEWKPAAGKTSENAAFSRIAEMKRLYVRPKFRGKWIGQALIERVIEEARHIGYLSIRLDTVVGKMDAAIALYNFYGFREISPYRENPQPQVLYMELMLERGVLNIGV